MLLLRFRILKLDVRIPFCLFYFDLVFFYFTKGANPDDSLIIGETEETATDNPGEDQRQDTSEHVIYYKDK